MSRQLKYAMKKLLKNKVTSHSDLPCEQGVYIVCIMNKGCEEFAYIGSTVNFSTRLSGSTHPYQALKASRKNPYIRFAILGDNFRDIERELISLYRPIKNHCAKDKTGMVSRTFMVSIEDIVTLSYHAMVKQGVSFKKYAEKLLADKANEIRKKQSV